QHLYGIFNCVQRQQGGACSDWLGIEFDGGSGDDAQGAFATNEQVAQVVAGIVLAQAKQTMQDFALSSDDFQPQCQVAGIAVTQNLRAARIGRQIAANGATAFCGQ